jgi:hypothetical protein
MISGVSTKRRMGLAQLLLLLFLLATFDRSPNNLLRLCRLLKKTQRRILVIVRENVIENPNEHEHETRTRIRSEAIETNEAYESFSAAC